MHWAAARRSAGAFGTETVIGEGGREAQGRRAVLEGAGLRPEGAGAVGGEEEEEGEEGERMEGEGRRTSGARDGNTAGEEPWLGLGRQAV